MNLQEQKKELRLSLGFIASDRATATGEEKRLRDLVENFGNRDARPLLARVRETLAALDVSQRDTEAQLMEVEKQLGDAAWIAGRVASMAREFSLSPEQSAQVEQMLRDGKPLKETQQTARRWHIAAKAQAAPMPAFNTANGVAW